MHEQYLLAALEQAKLGRGLCAPNPSVGALAVQNGIIIAQAWHRGAGTSHAEQLLLAQISPKMPGVTLYITLEPCNHWGKTPPCVESIINYGVEEVVFGFLDPNPLVKKNNSTHLLQQHGIKVRYLPLPQIAEFYKSYAYWTETQRPRVTVKLAQTLNGAIGRRTGERLILSNDLCAQFTHQLRAQTDVILTTAKTIKADNPRLNVRLDSEPRSKPVAIIDSHLSLNEEAHIFSSASRCLIYHAGNPVSFYPNSTFYVLEAHNRRLDLKALLNHLGGLGYHDVFVEAGAELFRSLHEADLVHKTYLYLVPTLVSEEAVYAYGKNSLFDRKHSVSWQQMGDNMILCLDWLEEV